MMAPTMRMRRVIKGEVSQPVAPAPAPRRNWRATPTAAAAARVLRGGESHATVFESARRARLSSASFRLAAVAEEAGVSTPDAPAAEARPAFPFTRIVGQDDMKLGLLLNVVDQRIGRPGGRHRINRLSHRLLLLVRVDFCRSA